MCVRLGFLAVLDASTLGEFRKYAIQWQLSAACRVAGFFGVLSSELRSHIYIYKFLEISRNLKKKKKSKQNSENFKILLKVFRNLFLF